jgi:hypothetical protein
MPVPEVVKDDGATRSHKRLGAWKTGFVEGCNVPIEGYNLGDL